MRVMVLGFAGGMMGAASPPLFTVDLGGVIAATLALITALVAAGWFTSRRGKRQQEAERLKALAEAREADGTAVLTHAQYEGFISEAAQRLQTMSEAAIARMEKELAQAQRHIAELEVELERAKRERNEALADSRIREIELKREITQLRDRVADLERRLESQGIKPRRVGDRRIEHEDMASPTEDEGG